MSRITRTVVFLVALALPLSLAAEDVAALYKSKCAGCHGVDGTPSTIGAKMGAKPLGAADIQKVSDADLEKAISGGKGKMPKFGDKLSAAQIKSLVSHIRTFAKK